MNLYKLLPKSRKVVTQVNNSIKLFEDKNIPKLQHQLHELYSNFNKKGGGELIINYPQKEKKG